MPTQLPVHRDDGELVGFVAGTGGSWTPLTVFGHPVGPATDREDAENLLRSHGMSYLIERWLLRHGDEWVRVEIQEAGPDHVTVGFVDYGYPELYGQRRTLTAPPGDQLQM